MSRLTLFIIALLSLVAVASIANAQEEYVQHWNGNWIADGTLFQIQVSIENNVMQVQQIESLGFEWSSQEGTIEGNIARVDVAYAGVTGTIQAELVDANTAIVFAASCIPEFMVVCALAKDRQALFRKVPNDN